MAPTQYLQVKKRKNAVAASNPPIYTPIDTEVLPLLVVVVAAAAAVVVPTVREVADVAVPETCEMVVVDVTPSSSYLRSRI